MKNYKSNVPGCFSTFSIKEGVPVVRTVFPYGSVAEHCVRSFCKKIQVVLTETMPGKPAIKIRLTITNNPDQGIVSDSVLA